MSHCAAVPLRLVPAVCVRPLHQQGGLRERRPAGVAAPGGRASLRPFCHFSALSLLYSATLPSRRRRLHPEFSASRPAPAPALLIPASHLTPVCVCVCVCVPSLTRTPPRHTVLCRANLKSHGKKENRGKKIIFLFSRLVLLFFGPFVTEWPFVIHTQVRMIERDGRGRVKSAGAGPSISQRTEAFAASVAP